MLKFSSIGLLNSKEHVMLGIKMAWIFLKIDLKSIPGRIKYDRQWLVWKFADFRFRKIYEEKNSFWLLMFLPILLFKRLADFISAKKLGLTLVQFNEAETIRLKENAEALKKANREKLLKVMRGFANTFSDLTLNEFNEIYEKTPFWFPRFLWGKVMGII